MLFSNFLFVLALLLTTLPSLKTSFIPSITPPLYTSGFDEYTTPLVPNLLGVVNISSEGMLATYKLPLVKFSPALTQMLLSGKIISKSVPRLLI